MTRPRGIAVITGSRAEFGLLSHLMRSLQARGDVSLKVIVTGSHLEAGHMTVAEIERDGIPIAERVPMMLGGDRPSDVAHAMGRVTSGMADALTRLAPDMIVVLGDRFEILASVVATTVLNIPVAHIHGGEITEGANDDAIRHAITKLSHLHFAAAPVYRDRIVQMGEQPARVFCSGALAVDAVAAVRPLGRAEIAAKLGLTVARPLLLVTYHPVTMDGAAAGAGIGPVVDALERFPDASIVVTGVNADAGHAAIDQRIAAYAAVHPSNVVLRQSLGQALYLQVMAHAAAVVGNSSSGVIEAPIMGVPTVNIGDRQKGRMMPASVISCAAETPAIEAAIRRALEPSFRTQAHIGAAFGEPGVAARIAETLATIPLDGLLRKTFHDIAGGTGKVAG